MKEDLKKQLRLIAETFIVNAYPSDTQLKRFENKLVSIAKSFGVSEAEAAGQISFEIMRITGAEYRAFVRAWLSKWLE